MLGDAERMQILEMIEAGKISAEEGISLLRSLKAEPSPADRIGPDGGHVVEPPPPPVETPAVITLPPPVSSSAEALPAQDEAAEPVQPVVEPASQEATWPAEAGQWRRFWMIPLWSGVALTVLGAGLLYAALQTSGIGFWFGLALLPFILGLLVLVVAWWSRGAVWLHLRVQQPPDETPRNIALSLPLPMRFVSWYVRSNKPGAESLQKANLERLLWALEQGAPDQPIIIRVDEGEEGSKVQIYIGRLV